VSSMKIIYKLLIAVVLIMIVVIALITNSQSLYPKKEVTTEYLEFIQINPPENYIRELESIIQSDRDLSIRERGVFTLTNIAIQKNETEKVIPFLKDIAMNEKQDEIRTAAYANIDLIRTVYPPEKKGTMNVSILGDIKKGGNITLTATVTSKTDITKAIIGLDLYNPNIELLTSPIIKTNLKPNESKNITFNLRLKENGSYFISITTLMSFDQVDSETIYKRVYLTVNEKSGSYTQSER
jgi:hypothetical protein